MWARIIDAQKVARGFQPKEFNPIPYLSNPHVQTILGAEVLTQMLTGKVRERTFQVERERYTLLRL